MNTSQIAQAIAQAAAPFGVRAEDLMEMVQLELGNALDEFVPWGKRTRTRAFGPEVLLHVLSGNTPQAALQSIVRGLLLRAHNLCKLPSSGLPEIEAFCSALPPSLAQTVELNRQLPEDWLDKAEVIVVFGDDSTIEHFQKLARADQRVIAHGHKVSFGIVFEDPDFESAPAAAKDVSLFDQQGCLSPHLLYVRQNASGYAAALAREMEEFNRHTPRSPLRAQETAAIASLREEYSFATANRVGSQLHVSQGSTAWTVIYDPDPLFRPSCLNRVVFVKPFPEDWSAALLPVKRHISAVGFWPPNHCEFSELLSRLGATRICPIGTMQNPPWSWHQDGQSTLGTLVRWVDLES